MHSLCFQSFGTNAIGANEEKRCGISENALRNICVFSSGRFDVDQRTTRKVMLGRIKQAADPNSSSS